MIGAFTNHLWQSTIFVLAAALVAAALRNNGAHVRHAVWVIASLKFLVPFALLMSLGSALPQVAPSPAASPDLSIAVDRIAQPFTSDVFASTPSPSSATQPAGSWTAIAIVAAWACGFLLVAVIRLQQWRRIRAAVRASVPMPLTGPVPVRASASPLGPGVVGVWRPVLLMPAAIERHLTPAQLRAVLEHEFCHIRRRDNLTAGMHMAVEAAFWFHPLVWWIGARMVDERERACDEQVLRVCGEPLTYAESILNVCKLYVEPPLACVSGVTGSDLKKRVAAIMVNRIGLRLNFARKAALTTAAMLAIVLPLVAGLLIAPLRASTSQQAASSKFEVVSIKPCEGTPSAPPPRGGGRGGPPWHAQISQGSVYWGCATLAQLVDQAYADRDHPLLNSTASVRPDSFRPKRVRGGPSWVENERFTIEARASVDLTSPVLEGRSSRQAPALPATISRALRAALEDRFQLRVRRATEQQDMYALTIAKNGLDKEKVRTPTPGDCQTIEQYRASAAASAGTRGDFRICGGIFSDSNGLTFHSNTMTQLANYLSTSLDLFVVDRTGVTGPFNFKLLPGPWSEGDMQDDRLIRGLAALGFKIDRTKGPSEFLMIESVQKPRPNRP